MSFVERRDVFRPDTGEAPFTVDEIFFSRTDDRGVILAGNYVFMRVSNYDWEQLIGAPHKLIRHPDMPRAVFWLMWDTIRRGQPIGAYVKNRARDGLHYWVYAVVMPFRRGYLSIRIKPCADILPVIEQEYRAIRTAEDTDGVPPADSAEALLGRIGALGYSDYGAFASDTLSRELAARDKIIGSAPDKTAMMHDEMIAAASDLQQETSALAEGFGAISTIPTNMRVIASRVEPSGGAISALAQNYWSMSEEMSTWFRTFVTDTGSDFATIRHTLDDARFLAGTSRILNEAARQFASERRALGATNVPSEKQQMNELAADFTRKAAAGLLRISGDAQRISRAIAVMRRYALGLSSTRVMCNIESARLASGGESLDNIITQLGGFQGAIEKRLVLIEHLSESIRSNADALLAR